MPIQIGPLVKSSQCSVISFMGKEFEKEQISLYV